MKFMFVLLLAPSALMHLRAPLIATVFALPPLSPFLPLLVSRCPVSFLFLSLPSLPLLCSPALFVSPLPCFHARARPILPPGPWAFLTALWFVPTSRHPGIHTLPR